MNSEKKASEPVRQEVDLLNDLIDDSVSQDPEKSCSTNDSDQRTEDPGEGPESEQVP